MVKLLVKLLQGHDQIMMGYGYSMSHSLTQLPLDKMATILADGIFKCIFLNENDIIQIKISLTFVPTSPIDNKPALVQVMAWC